MVKVTTRPEFAFGTASPIPRSFVTSSPNARTSFDVTPDGRFLGMFPPNGPGQFKPPREIAIVLDWFEEIRAKVRRQAEHACQNVKIGRLLE
jgi:hypothetical protein